MDVQMLSKVCNISKEMLQVAILTENMRLSAMIDVVKSRLSKSLGAFILLPRVRISTPLLLLSHTLFLYFFQICNLSLISPLGRKERIETYKN